VGHYGKGDCVKGRAILVSIFLVLLQANSAKSIPKELWGTWVVRREVPTTMISCWGEKEAKRLIGTEVEYSAQLFRWNKLRIMNPKAEKRTITSKQFHDENSGQGANSSEVTFRQLDIHADQATRVVIQHPPASIARATGEIPGDSVLIKDNNTIVFSVCGVFFEAERSVTPPPN
jgi:hypothetical protein